MLVWYHPPTEKPTKGVDNEMWLLSLGDVHMIHTGTPIPGESHPNVLASFGQAMDKL
jgi:hypothetical protein